MHVTSVSAARLSFYLVVTDVRTPSRIAGVDTSAPTFGFMLWELSRRPEIVQQLRNELDEVMPDRRTFPDYTTLVKLPYLSAFLDEGEFTTPP